MTLRKIFEHVSQGRDAITAGDLRRVAEDAGAATSVMGFDVIDKMWARLAPKGEAQLDWDTFCRRSTALLPSRVSKDPGAAAEKVRQLFDAADQSPRNDAVSYDELKDAIAPGLSFFIRSAASKAAAQLAFAVLGKDREREEIRKQDVEALLADLRGRLLSSI